MFRKKYKYTCIVDTMYTLWLYLLYMPLESIQHTRFFVSSTIIRSVQSKPGNVIYLDIRHPKLFSKLGLLNGRLYLLSLRFYFWLLHLIYVSGTEVYGQDHIAIFERLLCKSKYVLLEDAPGALGYCYASVVLNPRSIDGGVQRFRHWLYSGNLYGGVSGHNKYCIDRIYSDQRDKDCQALSSKKSSYANLEYLWRTSSDEKRNLICSCFGLTKNDLSMSANLQTLILTQPFVEENVLSEAEMLSIWQPVFAKYKDSGIAVKRHPRDKFDYLKYFPYIRYLNESAPMQFLCIVGITFRRAVTVMSTAVSLLPKETEVVWLGTKIHPKLLAHYGDFHYMNFH